MSALALFAILQVLAVAAHYSSAIRQHVANSALEARDQREAPEPVAAVQLTQISQPTPPPAELLKAQQLFAESDRNYRVGDFEMSLKLIDEVEVLMPGDPSVLLRKAQILERLEQYGQAVVALEAALKSPGLPAEFRVPAEQKLAELAERLGSGGAKTPAGSSTAQMEVAEAGQDAVRDAVGLQPGSNLGIIDARLRDAKTGLKSLRVAVKSRPGETINIPDVRIFIYFYEETEDGEVVGTDSQVKTQWLSPPVDWAADEPELLEGQYPLPESGLPGSATANGITGRKYHGFVVAVYYKNELQDFRSEPARLAKDFPLPLYLKDQ